LRRRMAFEREFGALNSPQPNQQIVAESSANFALLTPKLTAELANARTLIGAYPQKLRDRPDLVEIRTLLDQIEVIYPVIVARQQEVLDLQRNHQSEKANLIINPLNDLQGTVQKQRETIQRKMAELSSASVVYSQHRQRQVLWLSLAATISTVLLGLLMAALIVGRITRPVRSLVVAMKDVQKGNLTIRLPVNSADEVGALTESFNFFVEELESKERIKSTFGKYIDPRIIEQVLLQPGTSEIAGARCVMTVLFADLVGFTGLSERLTPSLMVTLLNRHFTLQAQAVQEHQGIVDKYIGDSVMAFWGPPFVQTKDTPQLACQSAQAQIRALSALRGELPELTGMRRDAPQVDLRIGMCTGEVVVGILARKIPAATPSLAIRSTSRPASRVPIGFTARES
jgi:class 3 adenylate cyclase